MRRAARERRALRPRRPEGPGARGARAHGAVLPRAAPEALLELGNLRLARGERAAAAAAFDALDRQFPLEPEAQAARARLAPLADALPPRSAAERAHQLLERGSALLAAGRTTEALTVLRARAARQPERRRGRPRPPAAGPRARRARAQQRRPRAAAGVDAAPRTRPRRPTGSRPTARGARGTAEAYVPVAERFRGTPWGEDALLALANHYQKDALDDSAAPWWRRLLAEYPDGRYAERAAWRAGWSDYRAGRYQEAAETFEATARRRPPGAATRRPALLVGPRAARARRERPRARALRRDGRSATRTPTTACAPRTRSRASAAPAPRAVAPPPAPALELPLPEPRARRARQLLLLDRLDEAADALRLLPETPLVTATLAWVEWRRGRLRPAIVAMKRAYPEWVSEAGDRLPREVWQVLFPIRYEPGAGRGGRARTALDPALVAALILQESSFDAGALSRAGARGLMQVMPATGRRIARAKGVRYKRAALNDPVPASTSARTTCGR